MYMSNMCSTKQNVVVGKLAKGISRENTIVHKGVVDKIYENPNMEYSERRRAKCSRN